MDRVGFSSRLGAAALDWIFAGVFAGVLAAIFGVLGLGAGGVLGMAVDEQAKMESALEFVGLGAGIGALLGLISGVIVGYFLYSMIEAFVGASPGKMVLGFKVGNEDGRAGDTGLYLKRWAIKNASSVFSVITLFTGLVFLEPIGSLIGVVMFFGCFLALSEDRQALHDKIAKTAIYHKKDLI